MYPTIRKTKTASGSTAVQVVRREKGKTIILKHIGSAQTREELYALMESAAAWMETEAHIPSLFSKQKRRTLSLATVRYVGITHRFAYDTILDVAHAIGLTSLKATLLLDLAVIRIFEPSSKLRAIELLKRYFRIQYTERTVYRTLSKLKEKKESVEDIAVSWARKGHSDDLSIVFYDVTTLYFETFKQDELRKPGFSKDNKPQQPQVVVGLLVTREGFPIGYEVFEGNIFEGKTMLTVLDNFTKKHGTKIPIVVADAAMLSQSNITDLKVRGYSYIVGARTGSLPSSIIEFAHKELAQEDRKTVRINAVHGDLIVSYSAKRYQKDKREMNKQIEKAKLLIQRKESGRRAKFVSKGEGEEYLFNGALKQKTELLLGMKGYYTNIPPEVLPTDAIIAHYHDLWNVEASFRMAKSDLATRPIFHNKGESIRAHILICFVALMIGKHIELKTKVSLRQATDIIWNITEAHILDIVTNEEFVLRMEVSEEVKNLVNKMLGNYPKHPPLGTY